MYDSINTWYESLSSYSQVGLLMLCIISVLGLFRLLYLIYVVWYSEPKILESYFKNATIFKNKLQKNQNNGNEEVFFIRKSEQVSCILDENIYDSPVAELCAKIKYNNIFSFQTIENLYRRAFANYLIWDEKRKHRKWHLIAQLLLPVIFWPFRGIEVLIQLLTYLMQLIGFKQFKVNGKMSTIIAYVGGIVGFIGSIASILSLFGISFADNA